MSITHIAFWNYQQQHTRTDMEKGPVKWQISTRSCGRQNECAEKTLSKSHSYKITSELSISHLLLSRFLHKPWISYSIIKWENTIHQWRVSENDIGLWTQKYQTDAGSQSVINIQVVAAMEGLQLLYRNRGPNEENGTDMDFWTLSTCRHTKIWLVTQGTTNHVRIYA
jgi:hypothetical protein